MADLQPVIDTMTKADTVMDAAVVYIGTVPGLIQAAVDAALAGGATADQLKPFTDLAATMQTKSDALAAALSANTPSPAPTPLQLKTAKGK